METTIEYYVFAKDADYVKVDEKDLDESYQVGSLVYLGERQYEIERITISNAKEGKIVFSCKRLE